MSGQKSRLATVGLALSVSLIASAASALLTSYQDSQRQFGLLNEICSEWMEQEPDARQMISAALKEYAEGGSGSRAGRDALSALGYGRFDFPGFDFMQIALLAAMGFMAGLLLLALTFLHRNRMESKRIQGLAEYLEQVNTGKAAVLSALGEDEFSKLEDEIYKTVTYLYQAKDLAVQAKNDFAENLSNIAHQIKTPITAISLSVQMMRQNANSKYLDQVEKQLLRLSHLEEALLALSRMDAGTLLFQKDEADVYTLLSLAADNLQELMDSSGASIDIPELGEALVIADLGWTMEAIMNLMKNCMEHSSGAVVHCSYGQNPLYTEIQIWDDGEGFAKEDMPHLFERFYRGKRAGEGGIGIGLALAKEVVERQNGALRARNQPGGGALFEIRFYSH